MRLPLTAALAALLALPSLARAQTDDAPEEAPDDAMEMAPPEDVAPATDACFPACRAGFVCSAGECVEACNPPCGEGYACSAGASCEPIAAASSAGDADAGYAIAGGVVGIIMTALSIGLYVTDAVGTSNGWVDVGLRWGGIGLPFITAPIVGGGALSATGVEGLLPVRIVAWSLYGVYAICSIVAALYAADHAGDVPSESVIALAIGGVTTELAFVVDALYTGAQANAAASSMAMLPRVSFTRSSGAVDGAVLGMGGAF